MKNLVKILFLFIVQFGLAQNVDTAKLDKYFDALSANDKFMGSVAISKDGHFVYSKQLGFADVDGKTKPNEDTKYRIGSITKTFTAVLVMKAIEEGKLKLDDKLSIYYPTIKNAENITIENLLNHRSGIANFTDSPDYMNYNTSKKSEKELVDIIAKGGSGFEPDSKGEYSNSNYVLLSFILQKVYKKDYATLLSEKITKPLALKNTYFGKPANISNNEAFSYSFKGKWEKEVETDMSIPMGAGGIVSTPTDLTKFAYALFNGKLVSEKSLSAMKVLKENYGLGIFSVPFYDIKGFGHNGGIDGFSSAMYHFGDENVSVAIISNGTRYDNNQIVKTLLSAAYNKDYEIPSFETVSVTAKDLAKYVGNYASKAIPMQIAITNDGDKLFAQATGQSKFPLEATTKDTFTFDAAGIVLEFSGSDKMLLKQGGASIEFGRKQE